VTTVVVETVTVSSLLSVLPLSLLPDPPCPVTSLPFSPSGVSGCTTAGLGFPTINVPSEHGFGVVVPDIAVRPTDDYKKIYSRDIQSRYRRKMERDLNMCEN
jgi:hypothetical protein